MDVMPRKPGAFHKNHGMDVRLLDEDTIAYGYGMVFTSQPIPQGSMFQVKILEAFGYLVSGVMS